MVSVVFGNNTESSLPLELRIEIEILLYAFLFLQINFILLVSRQGKTRLTKWFVQMNSKVRSM